MVLIEKIERVTRIAFFMSATVLCLYGLSLLHAGRVAAPSTVASLTQGVNARIDTLVTKVDTHLTSLDNDVAAITDTLTNKKTGLLVIGIPKAIASVASAGLTTSQVLAEERDAFVPQSKAFQTTAENASSVLTNLSGAITDLRTSNQKFAALVSAVDPALVAHITQNIDNTATAMTNTAVNADVAMSHFEVLTARFDKMAEDGERITGDGADYFHKLTHPTTWQRILSGLESGGSLAAWAALHKP